SAGADGTVRVWEADTEAGVPILRGHSSYVRRVVFSPDGNWIASGSADHTLRLWEALTGKTPALPRHPTPLVGPPFSPDGASLVAACENDDRLHVWNVAAARLRHTVHGPGPAIQALAIAPDGVRIAAVTMEGAMSIVNAATGQEAVRWHLARVGERRT